MEKRVLSDIAQLRQVVMHRPDAGIEQVAPGNFEELLYDDVVYLDHMQQEHDIFTSCIRTLIGEEAVLDVQDLLAEVLQEDTLRREMLGILGQLNGDIARAKDHLLALPSQGLAQTLITGSDEGQTLFSPVPNLIYTRDTGVMVGDHLLTCHHRKRPRKRETVFTWFISHYHPRFRESIKGYIDLSADATALSRFVQEDDFLSIEGGDVMMLAPDHLVLALSDRSTRRAVDLVIEQLFEKGVVSQCTVVKIPEDHTYMHLDTVMTQINHRDFVLMEPVMLDNARTYVWHYAGDLSRVTEYPTVKEFLQEQLGDVRLIACGGGSDVAAHREQWTAGCNFTALKPGVVFTYDRNKRTREALVQHGYSEITAQEAIVAARAGELTIESMENTLISIPSAELARGGGGPHCLTFPVARG